MNYLVGGQVPVPMGNAHPNVVPYRPFAVADGHVILAVGNDRQFKALCAMLNRNDLAEDKRFQDNAGRLQFRGALEVELEAEFAQRSREEVLSAMVEFGVPGGPINAIDQVFADQQVVTREMQESFTTPRGAHVSLTRFPAKLSKTPAKISTLPPALGADSRAVLRNRLNITDAELDRLASEGIIGTSRRR